MEQQENELEQARREIDAVDAEMAALFCRRMDAVRRVAAYKQARGLPVLDASREEAVVAKNCARLPDEAYAEYYEDFIRHTMGLSRAFQRAVLGMGTVAYQGVEGAFSHIALTRLFQHVRAQAYPTWAEVFDAVAGGDAAYGVLPFENSHAGDVSEVLDLCYAHRDICVAEAGDKSVAAIASLETAALYGLSVLAENINTSETNTTRFIVIGRRMNAAGNRFSLLFTVDHRAGRLARVMQLIGAMGFNLECIKSRPMPNVPWEYYFYVEVVGDLSAEKSKELLDTLSGVCRTVRVLGVYDRQAAR